MDKFHSGMLHICFGLDTNFINPCKILIQEILANTKEKCVFHFIGIGEQNMGTTATCLFYPNPDLSYFTVENLNNYFHLSKAAMYRLLIPFIINTDRVLYLDIDTLILKDLKPLFEKEIDLAGAVVDSMSECNKNILKSINNNKLNLKTYFNSGVILFNSRKIREEMPDYREKMLEVQKRYKLYFKDQDIFNILFSDRISKLDYEYNVNINNMKEPNETEKVSKAKDRAYKNPAIVHCMGPKKWWNSNDLPFSKEWTKIKI